VLGHVAGSILTASLALTAVLSFAFAITDAWRHDR
jgi:hypothetical protein